MYIKDICTVNFISPLNFNVKFLKVTLIYFLSSKISFVYNLGILFANQGDSAFDKLYSEKVTLGILFLKKHKQ